VSIPDDAPGPDPLAVFAAWREEVRAEAAEPDAVALATSSPDGAPSVRFVLLRGISADGVRFFTNYRSRKGGELESNPRASIAWFCSASRRQVRVAGAVARVSAADSDRYFASRDRGHQLGAHASAQSEPLRDRAELEGAYAAAAARFEGREVERPAHWGGYELRASAVELWLQRDDRLHDRFAYVRGPDGWSAVRLAP